MYVPRTKIINQNKSSNHLLGAWVVVFATEDRWFESPTCVFCCFFNIYIVMSSFFCLQFGFRHFDGRYFGCLHKNAHSTIILTGSSWQDFSNTVYKSCAKRDLRNLWQQTFLWPHLLYCHDAYASNTKLSGRQLSVLWSKGQIL
jgi:hypothetical protein